MSVQHATVPIYINPALAPAMEALDTALWGAGYTPSARETIVRLAAIHGEPTASTELCDEDEADTVDAWIEALPEVPFDDSAWSHDDVFLDVEWLAEGTHPFPVGTEPDGPDGPDAPDDGPHCRFPGVEALPPIRGGSDEAEPFEPSAEDLADYHAWSEELDRRRNAGDRHSPDNLARIHLALYGRSEPFHA